MRLGGLIKRDHSDKARNGSCISGSLLREQRKQQGGCCGRRASDIQGAPCGLRNERCRLCLIDSSVGPTVVMLKCIGCYVEGNGQRYQADDPAEGKASVSHLYPPGIVNVFIQLILRQCAAVVLSKYAIVVRIVIIANIIVLIILGNGNDVRLLVFLGQQRGSFVDRHFEFGYSTVLAVFR